MSRSLLIFIALIVGPFSVCAGAAELTGRVVDADSGQPLAARIYLQNLQDKTWHFVSSQDPAGSAFPYQEQWVPMPDSTEIHTTVTAHPFRVELPRGTYRLTVERGKEYFPLSVEIEVSDTPVHHNVRLQRWVNMAQHGWYSGETHVHRRPQELANIQLAEDLNVAFPVTFWTTNANESPNLEPSPLRRQGPSPFGPRQDFGYQPQTIDNTHLWFPRNTEYEVFNVDSRRHVLGALFILNHRTVFSEGMPPVGTIAAQAHAEGALLDLDKHSWPWSMMLIPVAKVDLYELANNSVWRTKFGFRRSAAPIADYMTRVKPDDSGALTELGWLHFGFYNYYALLNCGFRLQPTAGTASGVHPVPLGYNRVYVHCGDDFSADRWLEGLKAGRSFVTNGPMIFAKLNEELPGKVFEQANAAQTYTLQVTIESERPIGFAEAIINGQPQLLKLASEELESGAFRSTSSVSVQMQESSWIAVRCFQPQPDGRVRFAHTAPWHIEFPNAPQRPWRHEVEYLLERIDSEIERNKAILPAEALSEFELARRAYARHLPTARP